MAKNEFLPFGIAEGANVLSNQEYERLAARFNGFVSGVAKSKELNTVWRQSSVMSSSLAQFIVDSDNKDLLDNGDIASIKTRLVAAIKQTISGVGYVTTAAMNLELNKKIDKASISGVLGNDNSKVPSLNLLTTELGKKQPAGDYATKTDLNNGLAGKQPAGDYATNAALNSGLDNKVSKSSVAQGPGTSITNVISQDGVTKFFLKKGEYGWGGLGQSLSLQDWTSIKALIAENASRIYNSKTANELNGNSAYVPMFLMQIGNTWANIAINHINGIMTVGAGYDDVKTVSTVYSTANTSTDRNGYLRTSSTTAEMQAVPIGSSVIWNSTAPIPTNFWPHEGRSFSAAEYPELAKIFPDLKLPDDRGYAIRIADNGRGIDVGRTVGTYQQDAVQKMTGTLQINGVENASGTGVFSARQTAEFTGGHYQSSGSLQGRAYIDIDSSRVVRSADETRMKNVAKILITRVK
ncbi:hypothetical protein [Providencia manganoxydans]|uniref:hypothetical protein n=1 Tax=Providencia manganoxydans TaxID=2923283 RepID=UPI0034E41691